MRLLISWSGSKSRAAAKLIQEFVPVIIQSAFPFMSAEDLPVGSSWVSALSSAIESADVAVIVVTAENMTSPWLMFEVGAISARQTTIVAMLIDVSPVDISGPLASFQCLSLNREGMQMLLQLVNERASSPVPKHSIDRLSDAFWPDFERKLGQLAKLPSITDVAPIPRDTETVRSTRDLLTEILERIQRLESSKNRASDA